MKNTPPPRRKQDEKHRHDKQTAPNTSTIKNDTTHRQPGRSPYTTHHTASRQTNPTTHPPPRAAATKTDTMKQTISPHNRGAAPNALPPRTTPDPPGQDEANTTAPRSGRRLGAKERSDKDKARAADRYADRALRAQAHDPQPHRAPYRGPCSCSAQRCSRPYRAAARRHDARRSRTLARSAGGRALSEGRKRKGLHDGSTRNENLTASQ